MAARRRLADTLLLNWIVTLSLLLILGGLVTFVVFLTDPSADRWTEAGRLIGATLFQVGAVTLLLELVHLERLLGTKVPSLPSEDDKLEVFDNGIYYRGVLYPNSTFTFFWTERPSGGR